MSELTLVPKIFQRTNRNFLVLVLLVFLCSAWIVSGFTRNLYNYYGGPFAISNKEILQVRELEHLPGLAGGNEYGNYYRDEYPLDNSYYLSGQHYYFTIKGEESYPSGVYQGTKIQIAKAIPRDYMQIPVSEYYLLRIEDKYLVVRVPYNSKPLLEYNGLILPLPLDTKKMIEEANPELAGIIQPNIFDTMGKFKEEIYWEIAWTIALIFIVMLGFSWYIYCRKLEHNPTYHKLSRYGDPHELIQSIDHELQDLQSIQLNSKELCTKNWIIYLGLFRVKITPNYQEPYKDL